MQAQELFQEAADAGHWGAAYAYALLKLEENESHISQSAILLLGTSSLDVVRSYPN